MTAAELLQMLLAQLEREQLSGGARRTLGAYHEALEREGGVTNGKVISSHDPCPYCKRPMRRPLAQRQLAPFCSKCERERERLMLSRGVTPAKFDVDHLLDGLY